MKSEANDIYEMLDTLALPVAAQRFAQLSESPELGSYTALQLLREVLEPQYIETLNKPFGEGKEKKKTYFVYRDKLGDFPAFSSTWDFMKKILKKIKRKLL